MYTSFEKLRGLSISSSKLVYLSVGDKNPSTELCHSTVKRDSIKFLNYIRIMFYSKDLQLFNYEFKYTFLCIGSYPSDYKLLHVSEHTHTHTRARADTRARSDTRARAYTRVDQDGL